MRVYHITDKEKPPESKTYNVICFFGGKIVRRKAFWNSTLSTWMNDSERDLRLRNVVAWYEEQDLNQG